MNGNIKLYILERRKRFMKSSKKKAPKLTSEDIAFLTQNTRYDEVEIREWFRLENMKNAEIVTIQVQVQVQSPSLKSKVKIDKLI